MLYSGGSAGNAGIGYAWSWDRVHWRKAEINPVFKNGSGPFLERCYTPSLVRDANGSLLLYRAAKDATRALSASSGNSGGRAIRDSPLMIRFSQSGHAVVQFMQAIP
jgi:hypothetical protein